MKKILFPLTFTLALMAVLPVTATPLLGPELAEADEKASERDGTYRDGRRALDAGRWSEAVGHFDDVISGGGKDADGALYWKAYAHHKAGERAEALAAISELESSYSKSRWRDDARALRMEMQGASGRVESEGAESGEDELKLLALNSLMHSSSDRALDMLERFLAGDHSEELRSRALFVLSQNSSERAREILLEAARGSRGSELQMAAIRFLGMTHDRASDELAAIYKATSEREVKAAVLKSYMLSSDVDRVLEVYRSESDPELRRSAVKQLGIMSAGDELRELYRTESSTEVREQILKALFIGGEAEALIEIYGSETSDKLKRQAIKNLGLTHSDEARQFLVEVYGRESDRELKEGVLKALFLAQASAELAEIVRGESDPELKGEAIKNLGLTHQDDARQFLVEHYGSETSESVKKSVLKALFLSQAAPELISIARRETDPELRKYAVRHIGMIGSEEAVEFMMEILEKD